MIVIVASSKAGLKRKHKRVPIVVPNPSSISPEREKLYPPQIKLRSWKLKNPSSRKEVKPYPLF